MPTEGKPYTQAVPTGMTEASAEPLSLARVAVVGARAKPLAPKNGWAEAAGVQGSQLGRQAHNSKVGCPSISTALGLLLGLVSSSNVQFLRLISGDV